MTTAAELAALPTDRLRGAVFTMGALHAGHAELMRACRSAIGDAGLLIVTIFVNPTQFNDPKDLARYPRDLASDEEICRAAGVDVVFAPSVAEMYPGPLPQFSAGPLGSVLEGASRPGHFDAVATVVHRLISLTRPAVTCFGEKDYQQLAVVRRMVAEAGLSVRVVGVPTVRAADGMALSSRNQLLPPADRQAAAVIHDSLREAAAALAAGAVPADAIAAATGRLRSVSGLEMDYLVLTDEELNTVTMSDSLAGGWRGRLLVAVRLAGVRLIDNLPVVLA